MSAPSALVLSGAGINCEEETAFALTRAGARASIVHVADLLAAPERLRDVELVVLPGGFSYGDDTGAGNALASRLRHGVGDELRELIHRERLILGICNGFQILVNLGLLPGDAAFGEEPRTAALLTNEPPGFQCRWVDLVAPVSCSPVLSGLGELRLPIAHGEGRFVTSPERLAALRARGQLALHYQGNAPNGSMDRLAGVCDETGRVLGLMPHPERAILFQQRDDWPRRAARLRRAGLPLPVEADGARIFAAVMRYFS